MADTPIEQVTRADRQIARQIMSEFLGVPVKECSAESRGGQLIVEGIRRSRLASQASTDRPTSELVARLRKPTDSDAIYDHFCKLREQTSSDLPRQALCSEFDLLDEERDEAATHITTLEAKIAGLQAGMREAVEALKMVAEDMQIASETWTDTDAGPATKAGEPRELKESSPETVEAVHAVLATLTTLLSDAPEASRDEQAVGQTVARLAALTEWLEEDADNRHLLPPPLVKRFLDLTALRAAKPADEGLREARLRFGDAVWSALKADANDLRKQQRIVKAFDAALSKTAK